MSASTISAPAISAAAADRREDARRRDGKFGQQEHAEADLDITGLDEAEHQTIVNPIFSDAEKGKRVDDMLARLETGVAAITEDPDEYRRYLQFSRRFHHYSGNNRLLAYIQAPHATHIAGASTWADAGGSIRKGAKAIWILAPRTIWVEKTDSNGNPILDAAGKPRKESRVVGFRDVPVFDISDIEGVEAPPVPNAPTLLEGEAPAGMVESLTGVLEEEGFRVEYGNIVGGANGYTQFDTNRVVIEKSLSPRQQAKTLAHEAGHVLAGHKDRIEHYHNGSDGERDVMEMEAESIAFMVSAEYGIDDVGDYSFKYLYGWGNQNADQAVRDEEKSAEIAKRARESAATVAKATKRILERTHPRWMPEPIPELKEAREARNKERAAARRSKAASARKKTAAKK